MEAVASNASLYGPLSQCPVTTIAMAVLYEDLGNRLPPKLTQLYQVTSQKSSYSQ